MEERLIQILKSENIENALEKNYSYLVSIIPYIKEMKSFDQKHPHHIYYLWEHTTKALSISGNDIDVRIALLLHDIGKLFTYKEINGVRHYKGHSDVSATLSHDLLLSLGFSEEYTNKICYLIKEHDNPITEEMIDNNLELCEKLFEIQRCDAYAHNPKYMKRRVDYLKRTIDMILDKKISMKLKKERK